MSELDTMETAHEIQAIFQAEADRLAVAGIEAYEHLMPGRHQTAVSLEVFGDREDAEFAIDMLTTDAGVEIDAALIAGDGRTLAGFGPTITTTTGALRQEARRLAAIGCRLLSERFEKVQASSSDAKRHDEDSTARIFDPELAAYVAEHGWIMTRYDDLMMPVGGSLPVFVLIAEKPAVEALLAASWFGIRSQADAERLLAPEMRAADEDETKRMACDHDWAVEEFSPIAVERCGRDCGARRRIK